MHNFVARATVGLLHRGAVRHFATVSVIKGNPEEVEGGNVRLRGIHIKSELKDAPNMIFFPEVFDRVENWVPFFTNPLHRVPLSVSLVGPTKEYLRAVSAQLGYQRPHRYS
jgi:hypothetical protein